MGLMDGKVVLVTGAARGIGRECALLAAKEGASVVVNDLGGSIKGDDDLGDASPSQQVVDEIKAAGGEAVADSSSVSDRAGAKAMVELALDTFGGLHSVINPAGILRDKMFHKMTDDDWDAVIDVHLNGHFNIARAAVNHFRDQEEGSFVMFTSTSGLIGNIGQANYAAAKMGIAGLSRIIAMEGAAKNVRSNVIAPFAWTRMIASIPVKDEASQKRVEAFQKHMRADQVAVPAVALASPKSSNVSGQIFTVRGNELFLMSQPRPVRGMARLEGWTPETMIEHGFKSMEPQFTDLGATNTVFSWDPI